MCWMIILIFVVKKELILFWKTFMEHELEKINKRRAKIDLSEVGARNFRSNIQSNVMMGCKLFLFHCQVALVLRSTGWKKLIRHPKD